MIELYPISVPVGSMIAYAGAVSKTPSAAPYAIYPEAMGWMVCDGTYLSPYEYPELFAALGFLYGQQNDPQGNPQFRLPDLQGQFLRGVGTSPESTDGRTTAPGGEANGVGSTQEDALQLHQHNYKAPGPTPGLGGNAGSVAALPFADTPSSDPVQGTDKNAVKTSPLETRPTNVFVYYLIKYTSKLPGISNASFPNIGE